MVFGNGRVVGYDLDQATNSSSAVEFVLEKYPAVIGKCFLFFFPHLFSQGRPNHLRSAVVWTCVNESESSPIWIGLVFSRQHFQTCSMFLFLDLCVGMLVVVATFVINEARYAIAHP